MEPHTRNVGPEGQGSVAAVRVGDRLTVTPPAAAGGWRVAGYPATLLRPLDPTDAVHHTFIAIAVGQGDVTLAAAGHPAFIVHIRVQRALVERPPS